MGAARGRLARRPDDPRHGIADGVVRIWFRPGEYAGADVKLQQIPRSGPLFA